jgi:hypothetical protein
MGTLKPGATYVYEKIEGVTYAREFGADPATRFPVGHDYDNRTTDGRPLYEHLQEDKMWGDIRRLARTNPTLQTELERVIMLYHLIKQEKKTVQHHRV